MIEEEKQSRVSADNDANSMRFQDEHSSLLHAADNASQRSRLIEASVKRDDHSSRSRKQTILDNQSQLTKHVLVPGHFEADSDIPVSAGFGSESDRHSNAGSPN